MARNRELSQLGSFIVVDDSTGKIGITSTETPYVGIGTDNPQFKLDVTGDVNFTGLLYQDGVKFTAGVGIGSTVSNPLSGVIADRIGIGLTDINFVGAGLSVTGYGSTVVVDFTNLSVRAEAAIPGYTLIDVTTNLEFNQKYSVRTIAGVVTAILPNDKQPGDFVQLIDTESSWDLNNLMVETQNNEYFKNYTGLVDSPLACDVAGATVTLVWQGAYWRVMT
tara:strand:+ start:18966 stop:19631 length:666 start_codon:yes stop_codon:yes gene_type:complete